ncbi:unknown [Lachnospiraceae bacterium CAG:215]|nr:unknown [Lachnospiraceae bacterium CAG:215]
MYDPDHSHSARSPVRSLSSHRQTAPHGRNPSGSGVLHEARSPGRMSRAPGSYRKPSLSDDNVRCPSAADICPCWLPRSSVRIRQIRLYMLPLRFRILSIPHTVLPSSDHMVRKGSHRWILYNAFSVPCGQPEHLCIRRLSRCSSHTGFLSALQNIWKCGCRLFRARSRIFLSLHPGLTVSVRLLPSDVRRTSG